MDSTFEILLTDAEILCFDGGTIYATWSVEQYAITFNKDGGSIVDPITADYESTIDPPANTMREGYRFVGWGHALPPTMPADNIFVTSKSANAYWIIFNALGMVTDHGL